jgi:hypothetical protein|tara:strand:- start:100 stop:681 length:582 start_codon:yes stop_codon:yes gene_type:complete
MAVTNTLTQFKSILKGGGARPNLFEVSIPRFPGQTKEAQTDLQFLVKGTSLPESTVGLVEVPFRGRTFKVAGDRTFAPWSITVINDTDFAIRNAMEDWVQTIAQYQDGSGSTLPTDYMRDAEVIQLFRNKTDMKKTGGNDVRNNTNYAGRYKFYDIWPTSISAIDLSYDSSDVIEEFTVEFQVNYWAPFRKSD